MMKPLTRTQALLIAGKRINARLRRLPLDQQSPEMRARTIAQGRAWVARLWADAVQNARP